MVTNPAWRMPFGVWQDRFVRWIEEPEEDALLEAAIFFDFRQLHGELHAEQPLRRVIRGAAGNRRFLGRLAAAALRRRPTAGFLCQLRGEHRGRIDLKAHGTAPIVDLARLVALAAGSLETATVARLRAAADQGTAGRIAIDLAAAFHELQQLRLGHQAACLAAGAPADDIVASSVPLLPPGGRDRPRSAGRWALPAASGPSLALVGAGVRLLTGFPALAVPIRSTVAIRPATCAWPLQRSTWWRSHISCGASLGSARCSCGSLGRGRRSSRQRQDGFPYRWHRGLPHHEDRSSDTAGGDAAALRRSPDCGRPPP